jgi:hypothetical protein
VTAPTWVVEPELVAQFANPWHDEAGLFAPKGRLGGGGSATAVLSPESSHAIDAHRRLLNAIDGGAGPDRVDDLGWNAESASQSSGIDDHVSTALDEFQGHLIDGDTSAARAVLDRLDGGGQHGGGGGGGGTAAETKAPAKSWTDDDIAAKRPQLSNAELDAIGEWGFNSTRITAHQRDPSSRPDTSQRSVEAAIDKAAVPLGGELTTYRGVPAAAFPATPTPGMVFADKAYATSSTDRQAVDETFGPNGALGSSDGYVMRITAGAGVKVTSTKGLVVDDGDGPAEMFPELIFPRNTSMRVVAVDGRNVDVEVVAP